MPTDYPPVGSLAILQALRGAGYDPVFYDIDALRPEFDQVIGRFRQEAPDVIAISAVVSTAYVYVRKLCLRLRDELPGVRIVLGGNLAASAELLHRFCQVDVCVIGEGERVIVNLMAALEKTSGAWKQSLSGVKGLTYLREDGEMAFTGYEDPIPAAGLSDPDYSILERFSNIRNFIQDPFTREDFAQDPRSGQPHRAGKRMGTVTSTKGCVARCTFCHRWDRGFRQIPPEKVIRRIRTLMERYNVGFIMFGDENFGSDLKALDELIRLIKPLDILWQIGGVRARTLDPERLKRMREAGCVALYYGFESGSPDILKVMEKNLEPAHNLKAARAAWEAGLYTCYQLVLGMPGETDRTVSETIEMVKQITEFLPKPPYHYLSINYIQALPGTPVYEYARLHGHIGRRPEDEDAYLRTISNIDAGDETKFLNFTGKPYLTVQSWRPRILYEATAHWFRVRGRRRAEPDAREGNFKEYQKGGYFNRQEFQRSAFLLQLLYPVRWLPIMLWTLRSNFRRSPRAVFLKNLKEWVIWPFVRGAGKAPAQYHSLRTLMKEWAPDPSTPSEENMAPLRLGR